ncbi:MAG: response regulator [Lachnospiraceae bacterium]|nr:response regulator [Lachnospiraceae bacterium]
MYKVMIIDDEASSRKLIRNSFDWESFDMQVAGEAASGIEAINTIDEIRPDLAFVDISMPFMNGIEFSEIASERYPDLIIVIMTAHDKFEYARKCVSLHIFEYMLKPMVRSEVIEVLKKAKARLDETGPVAWGETENASEQQSSAMESVMKYIQTNYTDSTLNLTSVAQAFGFSSSYLSRKFKAETGKGFAQYLTECRMENAIKLAGPDVKMFNISARVGIPDPNYFGRCFKKYTGKSYSDYAASLDAQGSGEAPDGGSAGS